MTNNMDASIPTYRRVRPVTKQDMERLQRGGQKADEIKQHKEKHHREKELPEAEIMLEDALKKLHNNN